MIMYKVSYIHKNDELRQIYTIEVTLNNLEDLLSDPKIEVLGYNKLEVAR